MKKQTVISVVLGWHPGPPACQASARSTTLLHPGALRALEPPYWPDLLEGKVPKPLPLAWGWLAAYLCSK